VEQDNGNLGLHVEQEDKSNIVDKAELAENFEFTIDVQDTVFILTRNNSIYKNSVNNLASKILVLNELQFINLDVLSENLSVIGIDKLTIFSITPDTNSQFNCFKSNKGSEVKYIDVASNMFFDYLDNSSLLFLKENKNSLYIVRGGNYLDIKNIFSKIDGNLVNVGRGGSQKAHILSPLDLRLSSYMMAMFNFNYKLINTLNTFNYLSKDRYLSYKDNTTEFRSIIKSKESYDK